MIKTMCPGFLLATPLDGASMGGSVTSLGVDVAGFTNIGLEVTWTGTPVGTFFVEASNSATDATGAGGKFIALTFATPLAAPTGAPGNLLISLSPFPFRWLRFAYERTAGTGALTVTATAKGP